ncbi:MAG: isochorismatase family protein [Dehalococcoidia bacterium]|nr:isochorismatase family protein [Dehalococcoidia bacterium]
MPTLAEKADPRKAAIIVVDVQNDFCHEDGSSAKNARGPGEGLQRAMISTLNHLIDEGRRYGLPVVFIQTTHSPETDSEVWSERRHEREHYTCLDGTWGAEFYGVVPTPGDVIVNKHRYSAFTGTNLDELLKSRDIGSVIVTGVVTGVCVESTAREAFWRDYYAIIASDCCGASSRAAHEEALERMERSFATLATAEEIISSWSHKTARVEEITV